MLTTVGVTGASGHLGGYLTAYLWERGHIVVPIGRDVPWTDRVDAVIHLAAPRDWRDEQQIADVDTFTADILTWAERIGARVINTGSWWQYAHGESAALPYSRMKDRQQARAATTLVPFSIYGRNARNARGFVPHLVDAIRTDRSLTGASREPRDFVHVTDVCAAYRAALRAPDGIYEVRTGRAHTPASLAQRFTGTSPDPWPEHPSCVPVYRFPTVPGWEPRIDVVQHIEQTVGVVRA